jgi:hypothetical protein
LARKRRPALAVLAFMALERAEISIPAGLEFRTLARQRRPALVGAAACVGLAGLPEATSAPPPRQILRLEVSVPVARSGHPTLARQRHQEFPATAFVTSEEAARRSDRPAPGIGSGVADRKGYGRVISSATQ